MDQQLPTDPHAEIRAEVAKLCARFPGEYWRNLDRDRTYPTAFVQALTEAGYLAALIPEEYGGAGLPLSAAAAILETIHAEGCNGAACHAQMYIMGTILRHGSDKQKGSLRLDLREALLAGGENGPVVVPGKPHESSLVDAVKWQSLEMPPTGKLSDSQVATLTEWVRIGAPMPKDHGAGSGVSVRKTRGIITDEDRQWWAFRPVQRPAVPTLQPSSFNIQNSKFLWYLMSFTCTPKHEPLFSFNIYFSSIISRC